jgi:hypothetical protein
MRKRSFAERKILSFLSKPQVTICLARLMCRIDRESCVCFSFTRQMTSSSRAYRPSDSQGSVDYSSDSDFDESPSISHSPTLEQKCFSRKQKGGNSHQPQVIIGGRTPSQLKDLLNISSGDVNYELGGDNWRSFWSSSLSDLGASYYHMKDQSNLSSSDKSKLYEKTIKKTSFLKTTGLETSSSSSYQAMNLLTQEKQRYVLSILNKMESQLEETTNDPLLAHSLTENASEIFTSVTGIPESQQLHTKSSPPLPHNSKVSSSNIQYAFENKIKYGHVRGVLEKVTTVIRKIRKEIGKLTEKDRKEFIEGHAQVSLQRSLDKIFLITFT